MKHAPRVRTLIASAAVLAITLAMPGIARAASPAPRINYQGVLRNGAGDPFTGSFDMVFHFWSLDTGGVEILTDAHTFGSASGQVFVTNGLFNATLGAGTIADGGGPGSYTDLSQVFRDYGVVWLEIQIGAETLMPRVLVTASAYALNASNLEGKPASSFVDTSASGQTKSGTLTLYTGQPGFALTASARDGGVRAYDSLGGQGLSEVGIRDFGIRSYGHYGSGGMPGWYKETQGSGETWLAPGNDGLISFGSNSGGIFRRGTPLSYSDEAYVAYNGSGIYAVGTSEGGSFHSGGNVTTLASAGLGISALGTITGGLFRNSGSEEATLASGGYGIFARGDASAGYFTNGAGNSNASLSQGAEGVVAYGYLNGGNFSAAAGYGVVGDGYQAGALFSGYYHGVQASGIFRAGQFDQSSGIANATLADINGIGVFGQGNTVGGWFSGLQYENQVYLSWQASGQGTGIWAQGTTQAGYFTNEGNPTGNFAHLANGWGVTGAGSYGFGFGGSIFRDAYYSGMGQVGRADAGIVAYGDAIPGIFRRGNESAWTTWTHIAEGTSSINGNGSKNFVQNHPYDPDAEIVYTALEGDEVGTYTRGSAVLEHGIAKVPLSPSFALVTNPDIGLTAIVTPRGGPLAVGVESVSTTELVVRAENGAHDVAFDYIVHGLRAGFEKSSVIRPRRADSPIPAMAEHDVVYSAHPEMRQYTALERFEAMPEATRGGKPVDLTRAEALVAAIGTSEPGRAPIVRPSLLTAEHAAQWERDHPGQSLAEMEARPAQGDRPLAAPQLDSNRPGRPSDVPAAGTGRGSTSEDRAAAPAAPPTQPLPAGVRVPVAEAVEPGDLLVNDAVRPGSFVRGRDAGDRGVLGIVIGEPGQRYLTEAPLALAGMVVLCKADATERPIGANDLLMVSSLAGHAMAAGPNPAQGSVIGKALEPMEAGTGVIRILVMSR